MYLRFRTSFLDEDEEVRYGVFQAAWYLLQNNEMYVHDRQRLEDVWQWFRCNLYSPSVYKSRARSEHIICWFKPSAIVHLQKMYEMIDILEEYHVYVLSVRCSKPGYVVYEDDEQVAVVPFGNLTRQVR